MTRLQCGSPTFLAGRERDVFDEALGHAARGEQLDDVEVLVAWVVSAISMARRTLDSDLWVRLLGRAIRSRVRVSWCDISRLTRRSDQAELEAQTC